MARTKKVEKVKAVEQVNETQINVTQAMLNALLLDKAKRFQELKREAEAIKAERDALKEELSAVLKSGNLNELQVDEYKLILSEYDNIVFDEKAFKEAEPEAYKRWVKKNEDLKKKYKTNKHVERFDVH